MGIEETWKGLKKIRQGLVRTRICNYNSNGNMQGGSQWRGRRHRNYCFAEDLRKMKGWPMV